MLQNGCCYGDFVYLIKEETAEEAFIYKPTKGDLTALTQQMFISGLLPLYFLF